VPAREIVWRPSTIRPANWQQRLLAARKTETARPALASQPSLTVDSSLRLAHLPLAGASWSAASKSSVASTLSVETQNWPAASNRLNEMRAQAAMSQPAVEMRRRRAGVQRPKETRGWPLAETQNSAVVMGQR
jgi:hypothetical protein